jgi:hypothetical protein
MTNAVHSSVIEMTRKAIGSLSRVGSSACWSFRCVEPLMLLGKADQVCNGLCVQRHVIMTFLTVSTPELVPVWE